MLVLELRRDVGAARGEAVRVSKEACTRGRARGVRVVASREVLVPCLLRVCAAVAVLKPPLFQRLLVHLRQPLLTCARRHVLEARGADERARLEDVLAARCHPARLAAPIAAPCSFPAFLGEPPRAA